MRLLVEVNYYKLLFGKDANVTEVIKSFEGVKIVKEKGGYGEPKKYIPDSDLHLGIELINEDSVTLPENEDNGQFENFHRLATERDELKKKNKELQEKLKVFTEATKNLSGKKEE